MRTTGGTLKANANGHRRRELRKRVLAEEHLCALCDREVDKSLAFILGKHGPRCRGDGCLGCVPHPLRAEVDEDLPRSRGGSPYDRSNCRLMHRACNRTKGTMTLAEARAKLRTQVATAARRVITNLITW